MKKYRKTIHNSLIRLLNTANGFPLNLFVKNYGLIFMLHRVRPKSLCTRLPINESLEIRPDQLEELIIYLKESNFDLISLDDLSEIIKKGMIKQNFVVFTLDDGYYDNLQFAYPVFKKHKTPFTIYVANSFINRNANMWWYELEETILNNNSLTVNLRNIDEKVGIDLKTSSEKQRGFVLVRKLWLEKRIISIEQPDHLPLDYPVRLDDDLYKTLSWEDLKNLSNDPLVTIGAHTMNHLPLSSLNENDLKYEINTSVNEIERVIQKKVKHFSYPYGGEDEASSREYAFVKELPYIETATTSISGFVSLSKQIDNSFIYKLPRMFISNQTKKENYSALINGSQLIIERFIK